MAEDIIFYIQTGTQFTSLIRGSRIVRHRHSQRLFAIELFPKFRKREFVSVSERRLYRIGWLSNGVSCIRLRGIMHARCSSLNNSGI